MIEYIRFHSQFEILTFPHGAGKTLPALRGGKEREMAKDRKGEGDKKKDWAQRAIGFALGFFRQEAQNKVRDVIQERIGRDPQVRDVYARYHGDKILRFLSGLKQSLPPTESEFLEWLGDLFETALVEAGNAARGGIVGEASSVTPLPVASPAEIGALFQQIADLHGEDVDEEEKFDAVGFFIWLGGLDSSDRGFFWKAIAKWSAEARRAFILDCDDVARMAVIRQFVPEPPAPTAAPTPEEEAARRARVEARNARATKILNPLTEAIRGITTRLNSDLPRP